MTWKLRVMRAAFVLAILAALALAVGANFADGPDAIVFDFSSLI